MVQGRRSGERQLKPRRPNWKADRHKTEKPRSSNNKDVI